MSSKLVLRELQLKDALSAETAHREMVEVDDFKFLLTDYVPGEDFSAYIKRVKNISQGIDLPADFVQATFLVADVDGEIVGRVSIRHTLNERLAASGGHIGYGVRPAHRQKGYASEILKQALPIAKAAGLNEVLIDCLDDNVGSFRTIEKNGGILQNHYVDDKGKWRRYKVML